jgi:hypothetical protein
MTLYPIFIARNSEKKNWDMDATRVSVPRGACTASFQEGQVGKMCFKIYVQSV